MALYNVTTGTLCFDDQLYYHFFSSVQKSTFIVALVNSDNKYSKGKGLLLLTYMKMRLIPVVKI